NKTGITVFSVIGKEGSCEADTLQVYVTTHPTPDVNAGSDVKIIAGQEATLIASGTGVDLYTWADDPSLSCMVCAKTIARPEKTTDYLVTASNKYGCVDSDRVKVYVVCDQSQVFIPNSFTPNHDGHNDVFYPRGSGLSVVKSFRIYNRWGELVFEKRNFQLNNQSQAWDGTFRGKPLPPDAFVYFLEGTCFTGEDINWKGDITIIK